MRKRFAHVKYFLVPVGIALACYSIALFSYTRFDAVRDQTVEDQSHFEYILLVLVVFQALVSIVSRKLWVPLVFSLMLALLFASLQSFYTMGWVSHKYLREQHMNQIMVLKVVMAAVVPLLNALACQVYLIRERNLKVTDESILSDSG